MKAILEFDLNDPDDRMAHLRCIKATDMALALFDILVKLKDITEFSIESLEADSDKWDGAEVVYTLIQQIAEKYNINIDELIN